MYVCMFYSAVFTVDMAAGDVYRHSPPNISAVAKEACCVAKDHVTATVAVEPVPVRYNELANQRSLSDKLDLSVAAAGTCLLFIINVH